MLKNGQVTKKKFKEKKDLNIATDAMETRRKVTMMTASF